MNTFCGLDFGTSNSTIGIYHDHGCRLVPLENNKQAIRSAIFCDVELKEWVFGQEGINRYLDGMPGRLMTALKTVLGSSLMDDKTVIFNELIPYTQVLTRFMKHIKAIAEEANQVELTQVVLGRPVRFHDDDLEKDRHAQNTLEIIAKDLGFKEVTFQYEPIAAALTYETSITAEQLALIVDIGGGTSDFTVIRLRPNSKAANRAEDVLANNGIHIAGTNFDQRFSLKTVMPLLGMGTQMRGSSSDIEVPSAYYYDLTTWHMLSNLYSPKTIAHVRSILTVAYEKNLLERLIQVLKMKAGHHILDAVEKSKQALSEKISTILNLEFIEDNLTIMARRANFNEIINGDLQKIFTAVQQTINLAQIKSTNINAIFYTGGSTKIPIIREKIDSAFPGAKVVQGDAFGSVGMGLTIEAQRRYG